MSQIGHNQPPVQESINLSLDDAYDTAKDFLDGEALETQGQADAVGKIISEVKSIRKTADDARKDEKRPHDEAGKAVQEKWKPTLERCDTIIKAAQAPLTVYLKELARKQDEEARKAREEAEAKARAAIEDERAARGNVEALEQAKAIQQEAEAAQKAAAKAGKAKAHATGMGRSVGLRTYKVATVTDRRAALNWIAKNDPDALSEFIETYATRNAPSRAMDGVQVTEEKRVA